MCLQSGPCPICGYSPETFSSLTHDFATLTDTANNTALLVQRTTQIDELILRLRQERTRTQQKLNLLNASTRHLPDDILSTIFRFVCPPIDFDQYFSYQYKTEYHQAEAGFCAEDMPNPQLVLTAVSSHWRQVARSTPYIWSTLSLGIHDQNIQRRISLLELYSENSGGIPLSIGFDFEDNGQTNGQTSRVTWARFMNILEDAPQSSTTTGGGTASGVSVLLQELLQKLGSLKLKCLRLNSPFPQWLPFLPDTFRDLEQLSIGWVDAWRALEGQFSRSSQSFRLTNPSSLRKLAIHGVMSSAVSIQLNWDMLRELTLDRVKYPLCIDLLISCNNLRSFRSLRPDYYLDAQESQRTLPSFDPLKLEHLTWSFPSSSSTTSINSSLLECLRLPYIQSLHLIGILETDSRDVLPAVVLLPGMTSFIEHLPSPVPSLTIEIHDNPHTFKLTEILERWVSTPSLNLNRFCIQGVCPYVAAQICTLIKSKGRFTAQTIELHVGARKICQILRPSRREGTQTYQRAADCSSSLDPMVVLDMLSRRETGRQPKFILELGDDCPHPTSWDREVWERMREMNTDDLEVILQHGGKEISWV
ncbi:hypothetical protein D9756_004417 [Leucocoprinus leucothites]|uniref:F-box domain-containing protein n=1 Tax=Leucocoprinus leucothites TaxID=201217 RepID=A0A8H5DA63_9AGAR|nr:hypothetical protein D9756_004417 [Leucoagaricus leucothites]